MNPEISNFYGNRLRVRVCGLCWQEGRLLMANHSGVSTGAFWAPPGGGLEYGESLEHCLQKEFLEETGLRIVRGRFLFGCEFLQKPLHAVELFFEANAIGGALRKGDDPEMPIIENVQFMTPAEISSLPADALHGIFRLVPSADQLKTLTGFFRI